MTRKVYNKLVRDRIPDIIKSNGGNAIVKVLNNEEFTECLNMKLVEEVQEFLSSKSVEELVDIFQVILAILEVYGFSVNEFEQMRCKKAFEKGEFKSRFFLTYVDE